MNYSLTGRDPDSIQREYFDAKPGVVSKIIGKEDNRLNMIHNTEMPLKLSLFQCICIMHRYSLFLDSNFGILKFENEKAIFKLSEVWITHESTAANRNLNLGSIMPVGTEVGDGRFQTRDSAFTIKFI